MYYNLPLVQFLFLVNCRNLSKWSRRHGHLFNIQILVLNPGSIELESPEVESQECVFLRHWMILMSILELEKFRYLKLPFQEANASISKVFLLRILDNQTEISKNLTSYLSKMEKLLFFPYNVFSPGLAYYLRRLLWLRLHLYFLNKKQNLSYLEE